jgi:hypothetical protein
MDSHPSPSDVPVLNRALRPLATTGRRPLRRVGTVLRSTLSFGRGLGTGIVRREQAPSTPGLSQVRVPDGSWHLPRVEAPAASGPVDTEMAALAASMRRNRVERAAEPVQRGVPIVARRMGRTDAAGGVGPSGLSRRLRPAESAIPRNDSHGADRAANPRDDDPPGGLRRSPSPGPTPSGPPPGSRPVRPATPSSGTSSPAAPSRRSAPSTPRPTPSPRRSPRGQLADVPGSTSGVLARAAAISAATVTGRATASSDPSSAAPAPAAVPARAASVPTTRDSRGPQGPVAVARRSPSATATDARPSDVRPRSVTSSPTPSANITDTAALVPATSRRSPLAPTVAARHVAELAARQQRQPSHPLPRAVSHRPSVSTRDEVRPAARRSPATPTSPAFATSTSERLHRRLATALPLSTSTPSESSEAGAAAAGGGVTTLHRSASTDSLDAVVADRSRPLHERVAALAGTAPTSESTASTSNTMTPPESVIDPVGAPRTVVHRQAATQAVQRLAGATPSSETGATTSAVAARSVTGASGAPQERRAPASTSASTAAVSQVAGSSPAAPSEVPRVATATVVGPTVGPTRAALRRLAPGLTVDSPAGRAASRGTDSSDVAPSTAGTVRRAATPSASNPSAPQRTVSDQSASSAGGAAPSATVRQSVAPDSADAMPHAAVSSASSPSPATRPSPVTSLARQVAHRRGQSTTRASAASGSATVGRSVTRSMSQLSPMASAVTGGFAPRRTVNASVRAASVQRRLATSVVVAPAARASTVAVAATPTVHRQMPAGAQSTAGVIPSASPRLGVVSVPSATTRGAGRPGMRHSSTVNGESPTAVRRSTSSTGMGSAPSLSAAAPPATTDQIVADRSRPLHERVAALATAPATTSASPAVTAPTATYADPMRRRMSAAQSQPAHVGTGDVTGNSSTPHDQSLIGVASPSLSLPVAMRAVVSRRVMAASAHSNAASRDSNDVSPFGNAAMSDGHAAVSSDEAASSNSSGRVAQRTPATRPVSPALVASAASHAVLPSPRGLSAPIVDVPVRRRAEVAAAPTGVATLRRSVTSPNGVRHSVADDTSSAPAVATTTATALRSTAAVSGSPTGGSHNVLPPAPREESATSMAVVRPPSTAPASARGVSSPLAVPSSVARRGTADSPPAVALGPVPVARRSIDMGSTIGRRAHRGVTMSADVRRVTIDPDGAGVVFRSIASSLPDAAVSAPTALSTPGDAVSASSAPRVPAVRRQSADEFVTTPAGDTVAAAVLDRDLPLAQRVAALNRQPTRDLTVSARRDDLAQPTAPTERVPSAVTPTTAAVTSPMGATAVQRADVRRSASGQRIPRLTGTRSPQVVQPRALPAPRSAVVMRSASTDAPEPTDRSTVPVRRSESAAPVGASVGRGSAPLVYRSASAPARASRPAPAVAPPGDDAATIRRASTNGRVVQSRSSLRRRTVTATAASTPVRRTAAPVDTDAMSPPSITEHLDSLDQLMEALEDRIMRALERRGGVQRGWF